MAVPQANLKIAEGFRERRHFGKKLLLLAFIAPETGLDGTSAHTRRVAGHPFAKDSCLSVFFTVP
jgi:hypothetical protein